MILSEKHISSQLAASVSDILNRLDQVGMRIPDHWSLDHVCYRTETNRDYLDAKFQLSKFADLLMESPVGGRLISTFKLRDPAWVDGRCLNVIELPAPKEGSPYSAGFEHLELVVDQPLNEIHSLFPDLNWKTKKMNEPWNAELTLKLGDKATKFHYASLESVVRIEKNVAVWSAIQSSGVLQRLADLSPLIGGTFPLDIHENESDVDILVQINEVETFHARVQASFGSWPDFRFHSGTKGGLPYGVCNFTIEHIPFEIFGESQPPVRQHGFRHFQIEDRLLKLGGERFLAKIKSIRSEGLKTEPAFGRALGLMGDPFEELLRIQTWSDQKCMNLLRVTQDE